MSKKTTVLLLALLLSTAASGPVSGLDGFAFGSSAQGALFLTKSEYFPLKSQAAADLTLLLDIPLFRQFSLGLGLQVHGTFPSNLSGGFQYRGYRGTGLRLSAGYETALRSGSSPLDLALGLSGGASLNYDRYTLTRLYFFYPGAFLEPYLDFHFPRLARQSFSLVMPVDYYFRKDLELSASIGIGLLWRYYIGRNR